ncbi:NAD(P)-dependent oxidoreductase [Massilia forsythiae]|uniref:NAD(P)-dependent oxidoreductase n=1 Tax=Massilia forsythiae TaxID=2728020 RepID=A0A7Z2VWT5_9BURK|nr:NAD(P)-dependent oxidoreductase [Massilia forsythiae]QJE00812.1 NAD(P)-dependent oxidoreductase [Massilia forsythiae]
MNIAFLGLGAMGQHMAANLLKSGRPVHVWNRSPAPVQALAAQGARAAATPAECGIADVVFSMLADDAATRAVLVDGGVLDAMAPGSIHVNMATVSVAFAREMAALHREHGIGYVAAPVLGRVDVAAAGKLNILAGGADELVQRVQPLLDLMGQKTWRFGQAPEQANAVKLACNLTLACAIEAMGEGAALAGAHGIPAAGFIELITTTLFAGAPVYKGYGGMIAEERYSPAGFKLSLGQKDVRLAVEAGREQGLPLAFGEALQAVLQEAVAQGDADLDLAALGRNAVRRGGVA